MTSASASVDLESAGVAEVAAALGRGDVTSVDLVHAYVDRIESLDRRGPTIRSIRCVLSDAEEQAASRDAERRNGTVKGPLHGVPVLLKDNIDIAGVPTTAGALALEHSVPARDAGLVTALREAGAVLLAKTNLTELANFMTEGMPSGYSSLGGQVLNPYDTSLSPSGSSSGSAAGAALALGTVAVGTETNGSIISPAQSQSLVGMKPTHATVPGDGIFPVGTSQDVAGPMTRSVADAAMLLGALTGAQLDVRPRALDGARLAYPANARELAPETDDLFRCALDALRSAGAEVVEVPALVETDETAMLVHEFGRDVDAYLARLPVGAPMRTLRQIAEWNLSHAGEALKFGQVYVERAIAVDHEKDHEAYVEMRAMHRATAGEHGVDAVARGWGVAAIVTPGWAYAGVAARSGYPSITVPAGYHAANRRPFGLTLIGPAHSDVELLSLAADYERQTQLRRSPREINPSLFRT